MAWNNSSVLVTGGCGFIGANLVSMLVEAGARVRVLDNLSIGSRQALEELQDAWFRRRTRLEVAA